MNSIMRCIKRKQIEDIAQIVRDELKVSTPVNTQEVINKLGGEYVEDNKCTDNAVLKVSDNNFRITFIGNQSLERLRFFVSHELGHLLLHHLQPDKTLRESISHTRDTEWEADEFAAAFLMPKTEFTIFCYENMTTDNKIDIKDIANHFGVSVQTANVRGIILNLWKYL